MFKKKNNQQAKHGKIRLIWLVCTLLLVGLGFTIYWPLLATAENPKQPPPGVIVLDVFQARAVKKNDDTIWKSQQDFFIEASVNGGPTRTSTTKEGRDHAAWTPPFRVTATVPADTQSVPIRVRLREEDDVDIDDFDINQQAGQTDLVLTFDTCTLRLEGGGVTVSRPGRRFFPPGHEGQAADVEIRVNTADGKPFSPNDVAIANATPVQTVFNPRNIIANKATAFMVDLTSSWTVPRNVKIEVTMSDGLTTVADAKTVLVPPSGLRAFLFDGSTGVDPYFPTKVLSDSQLTFSVIAGVEGEPPVAPPPTWSNCYATNNEVDNASLPVIATVEHRTVYAAFDWFIFGRPDLDMPSRDSVDLTRDSNERLRKAIFPIAGAPSEVSPVALIGFPSIWLEPGPTMMTFSAGASFAGIDHLILMPRQGWFADNRGILTFCTTGSGCSGAEYMPHAVIAEANLSETSVHEVGHTHRLSQHNCSTGGILEDWFNFGCRDERTHAPADGAPYFGTGYDVEGNVFPVGFGGAPPGTRQVTANNIMGAGTGLPPGSFTRWIDNFTFNYLSEELRAPQDPTLINLTGYVQATGGLSPTAVFSGTLLPTFQFEGIPDVEERPYEVPAGAGVFAVRLVTGQGSRIYRFTPAFMIEGTDTGGFGAFSFNVPWDPATERLDLYGPSNSVDPGQNQDVLLFARNRSNASPTVNTLRAGVENPPNLGGPKTNPPVVPPERDIIVAWNGADLDSPQLSAVLLLDPPAYNGEDVGWLPVGVKIEGNQFTIQANTLLAPGDYKARIGISDGINAASYEVDHLFTIQTLDNNIYLPIIVK